MRSWCLVLLTAAFAAGCQSPPKKVPQGRIEVEPHPEFASIRPVAIAVLPVDSRHHELRRLVRQDVYEALFHKKYSPFKLGAVDAHIDQKGRFQGGSLEWDATLSVEISRWAKLSGTRYYLADGRAVLRHKLGEIAWQCRFDQYPVEVPAHAGQIELDEPAKAIANLIVDRLPELPATTGG